MLHDSKGRGLAASMVRSLNGIVGVSLSCLGLASRMIWVNLRVFFIVLGFGFVFGLIY